MGRIHSYIKNSEAHVTIHQISKQTIGWITQVLKEIVETLSGNASIYLHLGFPYGRANSIWEICRVSNSVHAHLSVFYKVIRFQALPYISFVGTILDVFTTGFKHTRRSSHTSCIKYLCINKGNSSAFEIIMCSYMLIQLYNVWFVKRYKVSQSQQYAIVYD